jgi:hypothetical protein
MTKVAASDMSSRILIFWLMEKCIIWESNLVASDEFKSGGLPEKHA